MDVPVFERYMCALGRWGAYLSYLLTMVTVLTGDHGWAMFFTVVGSGLLGNVVALEDRR